jgi:hypothetical protein
VQQFVLKFDARPPAVPQIPGLIQCLARGTQLRLTLVNATRETRSTLERLRPSSIAEVPISLDDAFVSYLGGNLDTGRLPEEPEAAEMVGGAP